MGEDFLMKLVTHFGKSSNWLAHFHLLIWCQRSNHSILSPYLFWVVNISPPLSAFHCWFSSCSHTVWDLHIKPFQDLTFGSHSVETALCSRVGRSNMLFSNFSLFSTCFCSSEFCLWYSATDEKSLFALWLVSGQSANETLAVQLDIEWGGISE